MAIIGEKISEILWCEDVKKQKAGEVGGTKHNKRNIIVVKNLKR